MSDYGFLLTEPYDTYRTRSGEYLTAHDLSDFRKCPLLYHRKRLGLVPDRDSQAYLVGRAAHTLILEGREQYEKEFALGGPINPRTGRPYGYSTKAFTEWVAQQGKPVLNDDHIMIVERMAVAVRYNQRACEMLSDGVPEGVIRTEYCGKLCQARLDYFSHDRGIVDLKTCDHLDHFVCDAQRYGYANQLAFYRALLATVLGGELHPCHVIAVEKQEPFRCGVWRFTDDLLTSAQRENEAAIARLLSCEQTDTWPTGYEEILVLDGGGMA